MKRALCIVAFLGLSACSREISSASPAEGPSPSATSTADASKTAASANVIVDVSPDDLTTDLGESVPSIHVVPTGSKSQALLSALAPHVALVTWPEQTVVETEQVTLPAENEQIPSLIELRPKTQLTDRWYAVRVTELPATMEFPLHESSKKLGTGGSAWRFRTGSGPIISSVWLCEKSGGQTGAVMFSERVDPGADPAALIAFDRGDCRYLPPTVAGTPDQPIDPTTETIRFTCDTVGDLTVEWKAGATAAGSSTIAVPAKSISFTKSSSEDVGESCRRISGDI